MSLLTRDAFDVWSLFEVIMGENMLKGTKLAKSISPFPERLYGKLIAFLVESTSSSEEFVDKVGLILEYRGSSFSKTDWGVIVKRLSDWNCFVPGVSYSMLDKLVRYADEEFYASLLDSCEHYIEHMPLAVWAASKLNVKLYNPHGYGDHISSTDHLSLHTVGW
jgi:hypothetical protein